VLNRLAWLIASVIWVAGFGLQAGAASARFHPRIGPGMGLVARRAQDIAVGARIPVVYHGGTVMGEVTVHTVFWAPGGFRFDGPPAPDVLGYEPLIQRFFADVAQASGTAGNAFSLLLQYPERRRLGSYAVAYSPVADSIDDRDPYPPSRKQCASTAGIATCLTDLQLRTELEHVIASRQPRARGLHDLWFVFLPPDVDLCLAADSCANSDFAGYHALSSAGGATVIYAAVPDPLIAGRLSPGSDPQGNPEAESTIDTSAHELVEAITDPEGTGWMDPNGYEVGDKCETPEDGTPLGYATDGSPYNQVIGNDEFLIQMMWSNRDAGCEQRSAVVASRPSIPTIALRQFRPWVSGRIPGGRSGVEVKLSLARAGSVVARAQAHTVRGGAWGPVLLRSSSGRVHGVGDDRERLTVRYGRDGPPPDVIATGDGGNPFTESGWTGWFDLDHGYSIGSRSIMLAPCGQTGVLAISVNGAATAAAPVDRCDTETGVASVPTGALTAASRLQMSSEDNRAATEAGPFGALVKLTVPLGEPGSVSAQGNDQVMFDPSGFPSCTAELRTQLVSCDGLVPGARYAIARRRGQATVRASADWGGGSKFPRLPGSPAITGGDVLTLRNHAGRTLTTLHVAHLRVDVNGNRTVIAGGSCEPGNFYGPPVSRPPISHAVGDGLSGSGTICPPDGLAAGLQDSQIVQLDDLGSGQTRTEVPRFTRITPLNGDTLYGSFVAIGGAGVPGRHGGVLPAPATIAVTITPNGSSAPAFEAANVDTTRGTAVGGLAPGPYHAHWVLSDANGDTRTLDTQFVEAG
jgi:hypothetical protein